MPRPIETGLYTAMVRRGGYGTAADIVALIDKMQQRVREGENPIDILQEEGFEVDYAIDLLE